MIAALHSDFNKPIGQILQQFSNLSEEQRQITASVQAKLTALALSEQNAPEKTDLYNATNPAQLDKLLADKQVSPDIIAAGNAIVNNRQGVPAGVPLFGDLTFKLGFVSSNSVLALLEAQSGERCLQDAKGTGGIPVQIIAQSIASGNLSNPVLTRPFIDSGEAASPAYVTQSQAANHIADIMAAAVQLKPELKDNIKVTNARSALSNLSASFYQSASQRLSALAQLPESGIKPEAGQVAAQAATAVSELSGNEGRRPEDSIRILREGAKEAVWALGLPPEKRDALIGLIETRAHQAGAGVGTVGTQSLPGK